MRFWRLLLRIARWDVHITVPERKKAIICVAPHTSNWDFIIGLIAYRSVGRKAGFLMKSFWFFFPLKYILKSLGGIPVKKEPSQSLTSQIISDFKNSDQLVIAITPEGTRKGVEKWRTGFLTIAYGSYVPIELGVIDYREKVVKIEREFIPTGNISEDLIKIRQYFSQFKEKALYPDKYIP
ncbi:MAG: 1-acyl-sn-glycerol-3-phosphate acyltransferase [Muribaculaceae bacterium]|nr:1-acyl-sn-glycerol-3-phosphate acyltransferase [Muribaculaceae bacterium]